MIKNICLNWYFILLLLEKGKYLYKNKNLFLKMIDMLN